LEVPNVPQSNYAARVPRQDVEELLRNLQAITDSALRRLDIDELLPELLDRVRTILDADTAAVLLVDDEAEELVARAARGLEEEVLQGVRVPIGVGFAGTIAKLAEPVSIDRVDETTVHNPILWEKGIRSMLGVPLFGDDAVVGVLHVGRFAPRPFTRAETELLQVAAERVAGAIHARHSAVESAVAEQLERSLMPARLPSPSGLHMAARYVPAEGRGVGGDWYDAFIVPDGRLWLVTGDVAGHGLRSAVVMGRVKSALRAYALTGDTAQEVLEATNRKVIHFEMGTIVTVICATAVPPYDEFEICSAGHPPPVLAAPNFAAELLDVQPAPPLGVTTTFAPTPRRVALASGGVLLLYTDGLIERRGEPIDEGLERLREATVAGPAELVCHRVMRRLVGDVPPGDDIAMLALQRIT
jgi:putative methionine-R-sulfoxide reductase with GAF domain